MLLTVDIGNTNVVMGLMPTRGELASQLRFPTDKRRTVREFMDGFEALVAMHGFDFSDVTGAVVSSVVPELTESVVASVRAKTNLEPLVVNYKMNLGFSIDMDTPERLGVDMIADAAGAVNDYDGALAIFDMGTATTCSVLTSDRTYIGSIILSWRRDFSGRAYCTSARGCRSSSLKSRRASLARIPSNACIRACCIQRGYHRWPDRPHRR